MLKQIQMSLRMLRHQKKRRMLTLLTRKGRSQNPLSLMTVLKGWLLYGGVLVGADIWWSFGSVFSFFLLLLLLFVLDNCIIFMNMYLWPICG